MAEPIDASRVLTQSLIDIASSKIHSLSREFKDRKFWMERHLKRIPSDRFVSEWDIARGLTTLAATCGLAIGTAVLTERISHNFSQPQVTVTTKPQDVTEVAQNQTIITPTEASFFQEDSDFKNDLERQDRTLQWKDMIGRIVADERLGIPEKEHQFWINRMLQIIFVESGGNPKASSGIAFGLTQLKPDTANEIAKKYKIPKYDLKNGWDNIFLGLAHQLQMTQLYGKDLAPWVHHLGMGNMAQAIITYLISVEKLPISEVDAIFTDKTNLLLPKYIERYQIDPIRLLGNPAVTAKLKGLNAFNDDTQHYYARLKAAGEAMNLEQTKV